MCQFRTDQMLQVMQSNCTCSSLTHIVTVKCLLDLYDTNFWQLCQEVNSLTHRSTVLPFPVSHNSTCMVSNPEVTGNFSDYCMSVLQTEFVRILTKSNILLRFETFLGKQLWNIFQNIFFVIKNDHLVLKNLSTSRKIIMRKNTFYNILGLSYKSTIGPKNLTGVTNV